MFKSMEHKREKKDDGSTMFFQTLIDDAFNLGQSISKTHVCPSMLKLSLRFITRVCKAGRLSDTEEIQVSFLTLKWREVRFGSPASLKGVLGLSRSS